MVKKKKKGFSWFTLFVILGLIAGAFYLWKYSQQEIGEVSEIKQQLLDEEPSIPVEADNGIWDGATPIPEIEEEILSELPSQEDGDALLGILPVSSEYGTPQRISENSFSYSDIKGLEIRTNELPWDLDCNSLNAFLLERAQGFIWWNTCRPFGDAAGISAYHLQLSDGVYTYEKIYFIPEENISGSLELESEIPSGLADDALQQEKKLAIEEQNTVLAEKNEEYSVTTVTDTLFNDIIKK